MSNTAALLGSLLCTNADINYYTQQSIYWNAKYEANLAKLEEQVKYHENWEKAYDDTMAADKDLKLNGKVIIKEGDSVTEAQAEAYAHRTGSMHLPAGDNKRPGADLFGRI